MVLKCNYAVNGGPALPGHWRKNVVTTSLGVPSTVLVRNLRQSLLTLTFASWPQGSHSNNRYQDIEGAEKEPERLNS